MHTYSGRNPDTLILEPVFRLVTFSQSQLIGNNCQTIGRLIYTLGIRCQEALQAPSSPSWRLSVCASGATDLEQLCFIHTCSNSHVTTFPLNLPFGTLESSLFSFLVLEYDAHCKTGNKSTWTHTVSRDAQRLSWQRSQWEGGTTLLSMAGGTCPNSCSFKCSRFCVILFDISLYILKFMRNLQTLTVNTNKAF